MAAFIKFTKLQAYKDGIDLWDPDSLTLKIWLRERAGHDKIGRAVKNFGTVTIPDDGVAKDISNTKYQFVNGVSLALIDNDGGSVIDEWKWAPQDAPSEGGVSQRDNGYSWRRTFSYHNRLYKIWYRVDNESPAVDVPPVVDEAPAVDHPPAADAPPGDEPPDPEDAEDADGGFAGIVVVPEDDDLITLDAAPYDIDRVELYHLNESTAADMIFLSATDAVVECPMFPLDTHTVRLQAVVYARPAGSEEDFKAYVGPDDPIVENRRYFCLGRERIDIRPAANSYRRRPNNRAPDLDDWRAQHLPDDVAFHSWPIADWGDLTFTWQKLEHMTGTSKPGHHRDYTYNESVLDGHLDETGAWSVAKTFSAGTHRFRVFVSPVSLGPLPVLTLTSCETAARDLGHALLLAIRKSDVATPANVHDQDARLTDVLRWATAFLDVPYEWGGLWFGGDVGNTTGGNALYEGIGIDCSGFVSACALLSGLNWDDWCRNTDGLESNGVIYNDRSQVKPGDLIVWSDWTPNPGNPWDATHVRIVYEVNQVPAEPNNPRIVCIEAASSATKVDFWPRRDEEGEFDFYGVFIPGERGCPVLDAELPNDGPGAGNTRWAFVRMERD